MVEPVAQLPEHLPGHLVGNLSVDLHGERDPAVPEYGHRDTRVNVERRQAQLLRRPVMLTEKRP